LKIKYFSCQGQPVSDFPIRNIGKQSTNCKKTTQKNTFIAQSCEHCTNGYKGRTGIYELMPLSANMSEKILMNANQVELEKIATQEGMQSLYTTGLKKVATGITSLSEIQRLLC